jgi:hypothetical protein
MAKIGCESPAKWTPTLGKIDDARSDVHSKVLKSYFTKILYSRKDMSSFIQIYTFFLPPVPAPRARYNLRKEKKTTFKHKQRIQIIHIC